MPFTMGALPAKDGAGNAITGGMLAADTVGGGAGPWFLFHGLVDGVAGANRAQVTGANALKVDGSGVTLTVGSHAVTNAGTFAVQESGGALTALQLLDDIITAQGTALGTTKTALLGASVLTSAPTYTTGQISPLTMDTSGALRVTGAGGGTQYVEDAAAASDPTGNMMMSRRRDTPSATEVSADGDNIASIATNKGKIWTAAELRVGDSLIDVGNGTAGTATPRMAIASDSQMPALANNADAVASTTNQSVGTIGFNYAYNGATWDRLQVDGNKFLKVNASGDAAHDAADTGNPQKIGSKATAALSGETMVAAGDRANAYSDVDGAMIFRGGCSLGDLVDGTSSNTDGNTTQVIAAAGAGIKQYLTRCSLSNTHATDGVMVALKSGTTTKWRVRVPPGGRELAFDPPLKPNAANEGWFFDPDAAVTTIECSMNGFKSKV